MRADYRRMLKTNAACTNYRPVSEEIHVFLSTLSTQ